MQTIFLSAEDIRAIVRHVGLDELMDTLIARLTEACVEFDPSSHRIPVRDG